VLIVFVTTTSWSIGMENAYLTRNRIAQFRVLNHRRATARQAKAAHAPRKPLHWTDIMVTAFAETKSALANAIMLEYPVSDAYISLTVYVSETAVGGVLEQRVNNTSILRSTAT
jgi:hypothetical protein